LPRVSFVHPLLAANLQVKLSVIKTSEIEIKLAVIKIVINFFLFHAQIKFPVSGTRVGVLYLDEFKVRNFEFIIDDTWLLG
jgi:hypothetical protein